MTEHSLTPMNDPNGILERMLLQMTISRKVVNVGPCMCRISLSHYQICNVKTKKTHTVRFSFSNLM